MMRALWSAASGMIAQQTNVDTISNNLSNVNTTGYRSEKAEFKRSATIFVVGAILVIAATNILAIISNFAESVLIKIILFGSVVLKNKNHMSISPGS